MMKFLIDRLLRIVAPGDWNMREYWQRPCTGRLWKRRFPSSRKAAIREFLTLFTNAFGFADTYRFRFAPEDSVMKIYEANYPQPYLLLPCFKLPRVDEMELENLIESIQDRYCIDLNERHEDITLGDLFDLTQTPRLQMPPPRRMA